MVLKYGTPEEAGMSAEKTKQIELMVEGWVNAGATHSFVTLAARNGIIFNHAAYGTSSFEENSDPLKLDTLFPLASITKPIVATAAMILADEGKLDIHAPVQQYIPEFIGEGKDKVVVHQLMTHTAGMHNEILWKHADMKRELDQIPTPEVNQHARISEELFLGYDAPLWKMPGVEMSYCNYGIDLLGDIIRRVSGQSLEDFIESKITKPLGMKDTHLVVPLSKRGRVAKRSKDEIFGEWFNSPESMETPSASSGAYSTALDMAIFLQMFLNKGEYGGIRILSQESVEEMTRNQIPGISATWGDDFFNEASWGYSWDILGGKTAWGTLLSPHSFAHGGAGGTVIFGDHDFQMAWIVFFVDYHLPRGQNIIKIAEFSDNLIKAIDI